MTIYPNPVDNHLQINLEKLSFTNQIVHRTQVISITDLTGKKHIEIAKNINKFSIDTSHLIDGVYILQIMHNKGVLNK